MYDGYYWISKTHRDGIYTDLDGVGGFVKECLSVPYERVLEKTCA